MYATCYACNAPFASGHVSAEVPLGREVAFDRGGRRLWIVCAECRTWNLSPEVSDATWDDLDAAYHAAPSRAVANGIGVAELPGGVALMRLGAVPRWDDFAAWRFHRQLVRRFRRSFSMDVGVVAATAAVAWLPASAALGSWQPLLMLGIVSVPVWTQRARRRRVPTPDGWVYASRSALLHAVLRHDNVHGFTLHVPHVDGEAEFQGAEALLVFGNVVRAANRSGATQRQVQRGIAMVAQAGGPSAYLQRFAERGGRLQHVKTFDELAALEMSAREGWEGVVWRGETS